MKRLVVREFETSSSPSSISVEEIDWPAPHRGDLAPETVEIEVAYAGVTFFDGLFAHGGYQVRAPLPFVPGGCGTGRVVATGPGVREVAVDDEVLVQAPLGGLYAERAVVPANNCVPMPAVGNQADVAATLEALTTMHFALTRRVHLAQGASVLVLGASGALGSVAVQIAKAKGAVVVASASSEEKRVAAERAGADYVVDSNPETLREHLTSHIGGGVDVVIDPVGGDLALAALKSLAPWGTLAVCGFASGIIPRLGANRILMGNRSVVGIDYGAPMRTTPEIIGEVLGEVADNVGRGHYRPPPAKVWPFRDAVSALSDARTARSGTRNALEISPGRS